MRTFTSSLLVNRSYDGNPPELQAWKQMLEQYVDNLVVERMNPEVFIRNGYDGVYWTATGTWKTNN